VVIVSTLLEEDRRRSCDKIAHEANTHVNRFCFQNSDSKTLQRRKVAAKWGPHQLSKEQKAARKRVAEQLRRCEAEGEQFLNRTVA
jgi:hypothetical protein